MPDDAVNGEPAVADAPLDSAAPGWLGKLACLGDFASRRLPASTTRACDGWLADVVGASRARLGERWLDAYLTSPLWRFAWAPGVLDAQWWFGVLMPSVDNVGRYFPLLVAQARAGVPHGALPALERWYDAVGAAALATLQPGASLDRFEAALAAAPALPAAAAPDDDDGALAGALAGLARRALHERLAGCSVWSAARGDGSPVRFSVTPGLPSPETFAQLLEGGW